MADFHSPFLPTTLPAPIPAGRGPTALHPLMCLGENPLSDPAPGQFMGFQWFDPASYGPAAPGTFGTCGVGTVRGPGLRYCDLSIHKEFPVQRIQEAGIPG